MASHRLCRTGSLALAATLLLAGPAAAEATATQAGQIEAQLRGFLAAQVGALFDAASLALKVTPVGDSYRLELPLGGPILRGAVDVSPSAWSAQFKPLDANRWAIEAVGLATPLTMTAKGDGTDQPGSVTIKIAGMESTGVLDTTLATLSTLDTKLRGSTIVVKGPSGEQTTHTERSTGHLEWRPSGPGRVNVVSTALAEKYSVVNDDVTIAVDRLGGSAQMDNVDFARMGSLTQGAAALFASIDRAAAASKPGLTPAQRGIARTLLASLFELMDSVRSEQSWEGVRIVSSGQAVSLAKLGVGVSAAAPGGLMQLQLPMVVEGLDTPMIPPGAMRELLPRRLTLTPRLAGVPKADMLRILLKALETAEPDTDVLQAELSAMLERSPVEFGLDALSLDIGPAKLEGGGAVRMRSTSNVTGQAELRMVGLDALIRRANTTPELKQAAPALLLIKGIGRQEGPMTVWHITYADGVTMVNDTNLSDMIPSK